MPSDRLEDSNRDLDALRTLFAAWSERFEESKEDVPTASFETFFAGFERLLDAHDASRATDPRFDVLEILRVRHDEVLNCRFLAWLLDPRGSHGLGAALLQRVTAKLALRIPDEAWQEPIVVGTESSTQDGRIDIEVSSARFLLAIEAKVVSKLHTDQDVRYNAWLDACGVTRGVPLEQRHLVWLSRESARDLTTVPGVRRLTWQDVVRAVEGITEELRSDTPGRTALRLTLDAYVRHLRRHVVRRKRER